MLILVIISRKRQFFNFIILCYSKFCSILVYFYHRHDQDEFDYFYNVLRFFAFDWKQYKWRLGCWYRELSMVTLWLSGSPGWVWPEWGRWRGEWSRGRWSRAPGQRPPPGPGTAPPDRRRSGRCARDSATRCPPAWTATCPPSNHCRCTLQTHIT